MVGLSPSPINAKTKLKIWLEASEGEEALPQMEKKFEKENPDLDIDWFVVPWSGHLERLATAIAADTLPDICLSYIGWIAGWYYPNNLLVPLDQFMGKGGITKENIPGIEKYHYTYKGKVYAIPNYEMIHFDVQNVDMFKRAGVPLMPQDHPLSYKEFTEVSKKLTQDFNGDGTPDQYARAYPGAPTMGAATWTYSVFRTSGVDVIDMENNKFGLNNPTGLETLRWLLDYDKKYSPPGDVGTTGIDVQNLFHEGIVATMARAWLGQIFHMWPENYPDLNVEPAMAPRWNRDKGATYGTAACYVMFKSCENREDAWRWFQFYFGEENQKISSNIGGLPSPRKDVAGKYIQAETEVQKRALEVMERIKPYTQSEECHPAYVEVYELTMSEIQAARLGIKSPEKALADAEIRANEILEKYKDF